MTSVNFDRAAGYYDATRGFPLGVDRQVRDAIVTAVGLNRDATLLELGVGTGRVAVPFMDAGYRYLGVDLSREMLGVLRQKRHDQAASWLVQGDVTRLPVAAGRFDLLIAVHVLHLVADWRATLHEARRALRPGGTLLLAGTPGRPPEDDETNSLAQARRAWGEILSELGSSGNVGQPGVRNDSPELLAELEAQGARVEERTLLEYDGQPLTARDEWRAHRERIYSSDWARPDDVHAEALARMERWLAEECSDPDTPYTPRASFSALLVRW